MANFRQLLANRLLLTDGAIGTYLSEKGIAENTNKSLQCLLHPEIVEQIHREYIAAGADIITTNSFDANPIKLKNDQPRLADILRSSVELAIRARHQAGADQVMIGGSIGPLGILLRPYGIFTFQEMADLFQTIAHQLIDTGADLLILETFSSLLELKAAITAIRKISDIPLLASMTFNSDGISKLGDEFEKSMVEIYSTGADACGINCYLGPKDSYDLLEPFLKKSTLPLAVMPNAGLPTVVNNKSFYLSNPQYFKEYASMFIRLGVNILGSCCGTTPVHTAKMRQAILEVDGRPVPRRDSQSASVPRQAVESKFRQKLGREFVITVEVTPPRTIDCREPLAGIGKLLKLGIDAIDVTENPLARIRMSPAAFSKIIRDETGAEPILHFTLRDRNLLAIQSDLLGAYALGIRTIFALKGDPAVMGDFPEATTVYDIDTVGLIRIIKNLNRGIDITGKNMKMRTDFLVGAAANSAAEDREREIRRVREKIAAGADYIVTQPVFDLERFLGFRQQLKDARIPVMAGLMPIRDWRYAQFLHNEVPGFSIPQTLLDRFAASTDPDEGLRVALEIGRELKKHADGLYIVSPPGREELLLRLIPKIKAGET